MKRSLKIALVILLSCIFSNSAWGGEMRRPLSTDQPMYIFHIDTWNGADPQKIIDLIPEDLKPYVVANVSLSVTESVTKDGFRTAESWLRTCAENHLWAMIQPASGGHSWFSDYDFSVYRYFFENYPNFVGLNYCEQFWGFDTTDGLHPFGDKSPSVADRMNLFANLLDICDEFGGYLVVSNCLVIPEWDSTSPLTMYKCYPEFAAKAKEHQEHLIYCEKYTMSANYYDMESMCLGVYLSGYSGHYGMRFDQCGYDEHSDHFPESIGGMTMMEHMMMTGQTVTDGPELIWRQCIKNLSDKQLDDGYYTRQWEYYPQFPNVYLDVWRKFTTDGVIRIMGRDEVIDSTRIAIYNDKSIAGWAGRRSDKDLFTGLYALNNGTFGTDSVYLKKTGRYPTIPTMPTGDVEGFYNIVKQSELKKTWPIIANKQDYFNTIFPPQAEDDSKGGLYVRRVDNNWLVYNTCQFDDMAKEETSTFSLLYNSCSKVKVTMPIYSFGLVTERADGLDIYLNNYRSYTTENTTDIIVVSGCSSQPTYEYAERGKHKDSTIESEYADGSFILKVTHRGPLDIRVKCAGANADRKEIPAFAGTYGVELAPIYHGPRQYEIENADYYKIDKNWGGSTRSDIPGFTALGYVSFGSERSAKLRDTISIEEPGKYNVSLRYLAPEEEISKINVSIDGTVMARNLKFPKTENDDWKTVEFEADLEEGRHVVIISTTASQSNAFYLDNMIFTPAFASIDGVIRDERYDAGYYNLLGLPVDPLNLQKGQIYIHKGKKLLIK